MSKAETLRAHASEKYGEKVDKILGDNLVYSTKLTGMIRMMEGYYDAYTQNQREIIRLCNEIALVDAEDDEHRRQIKRTTQNKMNKIENMDSRFHKFFALFNKEFTSLFIGDNLEELLLDAFDRFWEENVLVNETEIKIRSNESN